LEVDDHSSMDRPPRRPKEGIFDSLMFKQTFVLELSIWVAAFGAWSWLLKSEFDEEAVRNNLLLFMVLFGNLLFFNYRSVKESAFEVALRRNVVLVFGVLAAQGFHLFTMQVPFMRAVLRKSHAFPQGWLTSWGVAIPVPGAMEIFKISRKSTSTRHNR